MADSAQRLTAEVISLSLDLPVDLTFEAWERQGWEFGKAKSRNQWDIAEWWIAGERFGDRRNSVPDHFSIHPKTCEKYAIVARAIPPFRRRNELSFGHHQTVAHLPENEQDRLLDWCAEDVAATGHPKARWQLRQKIEAETRPALPIEQLDYRAIAQAIDAQLAAHPAHRSRSPRINLDTSAAVSPVPPELAALRPEPPQAIDRVAVAEAALDQLTDAEGEGVIARWKAKRAVA
jgi:hypothetical protein